MTYECQHCKFTTKHLDLAIEHAENKEHSLIGEDEERTVEISLT